MSNFKNNNIFSGIAKALDSNAPTLATFGSIIGVAATIWFMHKASKNAGQEQTEYEAKVATIEAAVENKEISAEAAKEERTHQKLDHTLRLMYIYRWALVAGVSSGIFALLSNYLNGRTIAAMGTMIAMNTDKLQKVTDKAKEMIGEDKLKKLKEDVNKDLFAERAAEGKMKVEKSRIVNTQPEEGDERFYDTYASYPIDIPRKELEEAIKEFNGRMGVTFNDWRRRLGLKAAAAYECCEWYDKPFKAEIGTVVNPDDEGPDVYSIEYINEPVITSFTK